MAVRGIKSKIALNVALLVLLSAILTDVLVVLLVQNLQVREQVTRSRNILEAVGHLLSTVAGDDGRQPDADTVSAVAHLVSQTPITSVLVFNRDGQSVMSLDDPVYPIALIQQSIESIQKDKRMRIEDLGATWASFWWAPKAVRITIPADSGGASGLHVAGIVALTPIYTKLRQYNKPILLYIAINAAILTLVGLYRIFRLYLRPIDRIVRQADDYQEDGDLFFAFRQEDNELNRLSLSLNRMLQRIKDDKKTLQATIASLEQANTDLKSAQNDVLRAEKMASVGRLAAGIAHEIGNPIGIVLGYLEMLKQDDLDADDRVDFFRRTEDEVQRINTIIRQLLDLARPKDSRDHVVDLHALIEEIADVLRLQPLMSRIRIELELTAEQVSVWANADQLRQVFLNLLLNAADAIAARGECDDGAIHVRSMNPVGTENGHAGRVQVRFEDNGVGMTVQQMDNIFDPFYTTKEPGKGTGLGLAVSYMIVERFGGTIDAFSKHGRGSTLAVELPLYHEPTATLAEGDVDLWP